MPAVNKSVYIRLEMLVLTWTTHWICSRLDKTNHTVYSSNVSIWLIWKLIILSLVVLFKQTFSRFKLGFAKQQSSPVVAKEQIYQTDYIQTSDILKWHGSSKRVFWRRAAYFHLMLHHFKCEYFLICKYLSHRGSSQSGS